MTSIIDNRAYDYVQINRSITDAELAKKEEYLAERNSKNAKQKARELEEIGATPQEIKKETYKLLNVAKDEGYQPLTVDDITQLHKDLSESSKIELFYADEMDYDSFTLDLHIDYDSKTEDIKKQLVKLDFREIFNLDMDKNTKVPCKLVTGNEAWYGVDIKTGHYRYFSRNPLINVTKGFDVLDMVSVLQNLSYPHNLKWLCANADIHYKGGDWMALQDRKYIQNLEFISNIRDNKRDKRYSTFFKFLKSYFPLLDEMQVLGLRKNINEDSQSEGSAIYFASLNYIANSMGIKDSTMISRGINILCLLGLINKVPERNVPEYLKTQALAKAGTMANYNHITFYSVPVYDNLLIDKATDMINRLKMEKVMVKTFSYKTCLKVFGQEITDRVFVASKDKKMKKEGVKSEIQVNDNVIALPF